jgi:hypothetical protein
VIFWIISAAPLAVTVFLLRTNREHAIDLTAVFYTPIERNDERNEKAKNYPKVGETL